MLWAIESKEDIENWMAIKDRLENLKPTQLQELNHDVNSYGNFSSAIRESITSLVFIEKLRAFRRLRQDRVFNDFLMIKFFTHEI